MAENITSFGTTRFAPVFAPCMDSYGCGDAARYEWPNNVLSTKLVVYDSGVIAKQGGSVVHRVDRMELERCERLARQAEVICALTIQRCVAPGSKLYAQRWFPRTALPELLGVAPAQFHNTRI